MACFEARSAQRQGIYRSSTQGISNQRSKHSDGTPTLAIHVPDLVPLPDHLGVVDPAPTNRHCASYGFTDMFGGTPSNLAISIMNGSNIEVIAAVNLPTLIKLASVRETASLEQAVIQAQDAGRRYIRVASRVLDATPGRVDMPIRS